MQYSLVIVDDEFYSRNGIKSLIDWSIYGINIVGSASSGQEGINLITSLKPDIVISDIRMNGMTGLEMITTLVKAGCKSKFIILSGYKEFEYAKTAIEQRVVAYLLKPVDKTELIKAIKSCIEALQTQSTQDFSTLAEDESVVAELLKGSSNTNIKSVCALYDTSTVSISSKLRLYKQIKHVLPDCYCSFGQNNILVVFSTKAERLSASLICQCFDAMPACGTSEGSDKAALDNAIVALRSDVYNLDNRVNVYNEVYKTFTDKHYNELFADELNAIIRVIELTNIEEVVRLLEELFAKIKQVHLHPNELLLLIRRIISTLTNISEKLEIPSNEYIKSDAEKAFAQNIFTVNSLDDMLSIIVQILLNLDGYLKNKESANSTRGIRLIKTYIDEHYTEDINLKDLEKMFYTELSYLSKLFKKETGMNYLKYITQKRIDKAKELLKNPDLTISQVASMVSYTDARYFGQLFKRLEGKTVSEYRTELLGK